MQSPIGSRVFRAILPGRIFILSGSKALQAPRVQFPMLPSILPSRNFILCTEVSSRFLWSSPCYRKLHRNRILNRISMCNSNTSTKVSGLQIHYLFLCLQCFYTHSRNYKKFHSILGNNSCKQSKSVFLDIQVKVVIILTKYIENGYGNVRNSS